MPGLGKLLGASGLGLNVSSALGRAAKIQPVSETVGQAQLLEEGGVVPADWQPLFGYLGFYTGVCIHLAGQFGPTASHRWYRNFKDVNMGLALWL